MQLISLLEGTIYVDDASACATLQKGDYPGRGRQLLYSNSFCCYVSLLSDV